MEKTLVKIENCFKIYKEKNRDVETVALKGIDLNIQRGEILTLVGPSGSGKTTLLNILGGLDEPSAGRIVYNFENNKSTVLSNLDARSRDHFRSENIGLIFQTPMLMTQYNALENVMLPLMLKGENNTKKRAKEILESLGLGQRLKSNPRQLSAGERQRVAIASSLVFDPVILLADEPTGELDSKTTQEVLDFLLNYHEEKQTTMVMVTHNNKVAKCGQRILRLHDGHLMEHVKIHEGSVFVENLDEYGRVTLPREIMEVLHYPEIIRFEGKNQKYRLFNAGLRAIETSDILSLVDNKNRVIINEIMKNLVPKRCKFTIKSMDFIELEFEI